MWKEYVDAQNLSDHATVRADPEHYQTRLVNSKSRLFCELDSKLSANPLQVIDIPIPKQGAKASKFLAVP